MPKKALLTCLSFVCLAPVALSTSRLSKPVTTQEKQSSAVKPDVQIQSLPVAQQEEFLNSLIAKAKAGSKSKKSDKWALLHPYIVASQKMEKDDKFACSTQSSGSGTSDYNGTYWNGNSNTVCGELTSYGNATLLSFLDPVIGRADFFVVVISCHEKAKHFSFGPVAYSGHTTCEMQEPGQFGSMVLERGKHGQFDFLVGTNEKLGGKAKVSKFDVIVVKRVIPAAKQRE